MAQLTKEELNDTKIWIGDDPNLCVAVQKKLFEMGFTWSNGSIEVLLLNTESLYIKKGYFCQMPQGNKDYFDKQECKEIFPCYLGVVTGFKKGDYIVLTAEVHESDNSFPTGYIFKQREYEVYLLPEKDKRGSTINGWGLISFDKKYRWRYATEEEIKAYNFNNGPIHVDTVHQKPEEGKKPYQRFKTKQEFIAEFGNNWKSKVCWNHDHEMDYLFGKEYSGTVTEIPNLQGFSRYWSINPKMITDRPLPETSTMEEKPVDKIKIDTEGFKIGDRVTIGAAKGTIVAFYQNGSVLITRDNKYEGCSRGSIEKTTYDENGNIIQVNCDNLWIGTPSKIEEEEEENIPFQRYDIVEYWSKKYSVIEIAPDTPGSIKLEHLEKSGNSKGGECYPKDYITQFEGRWIWPNIPDVKLVERRNGIPINRRIPEEKSQQVQSEKKELIHPDANFRPGATVYCINEREKAFGKKGVVLGFYSAEDKTYNVIVDFEDFNRGHNYEGDTVYDNYGVGFHPKQSADKSVLHLCQHDLKAYDGDIDPLYREDEGIGFVSFDTSFQYPILSDEVFPSDEKINFISPSKVPALIDLDD